MRSAGSCSLTASGKSHGVHPSTHCFGRRTIVVTRDYITSGLCLQKQLYFRPKGSVPFFICFQNQLILGVVGIDVALDDIKKLTPRYNVRKNCMSFPWNGIVSHSCLPHGWLRFKKKEQELASRERETL